MPCACWGCGEDVVAIIAHPNGRRAVCDEHVADYRVIREVGA